VFKKRWSDGLQDDFDHLNEFEFKLGCFGGDGGGSSGGGGYGGNLGSSGYGDGDSDTGGLGSADEDTGFSGGGGGGNDAVSDALADALNTNIGDYSVDDTNVNMADTGKYGAEPSISSFADLQSQVSNLANQSLASKNSTAVSDFQNQLASGMFSGPPSAPPSYGTPASYGPNAGVPTGYSVGVPAMDLDIGINAPVSDNLSGYTSTGTPTSVSDALAQALGINNNIAGFNVAPGMVGNAPGLIGTTKFREGGAVGYPGYGQSMSGGGGIMSVLEPFGNYLNEQIDVQRVDPFLETVSNAAYQEFGIKPDQGGGGGFFSGDFYKTNLGGDFSGMPPPLPAVQNPGADNSGAYKVDLIGNDHVGDGLFGGPMSGGTPTQLPGPRIPTFVDPPRKTSGGNMTPGGPEIDLMGNIAQPPVPQDVRSAYDAAVKSAQERRKNGFMGRVVLPGEMGFDRFAEGYNYRLNNPNQQPLTSVGNDGFGSFTQGPLDFLDGSNIAQPTLGGNVGGDKLMGVLPNGGVSSGQQSPQDLLRQAQSRMMQQDVKSPELQAYLDNVIQTGGNPTIPEPQTNYLSLGTLPVSSMPPGFTPLPPGELGFTENMMGPIQGYAGGPNFDESAPYPISMQLARRQFG
jgi:hypothetical protein